MTIELQRHRPARLPRRARGGAPRRPAVPRRRRARPRARAGGAERPDRGCGRLPARSSPASGRSRMARAYHLLEAFAAAIAEALLARVAGRRACGCACASRTSCSIRPSSTRPSRVERRAARSLSRSRDAEPVRRLAHALRRVRRRGTRTGRALVREREPLARPGCDRSGEPIVSRDALDDAGVPCFQSPRSTLRVGGQGGGDAAVLRQPDAVDVAGVLDPVEARLHRRRRLRLRRQRRDRVVVETSGRTNSMSSFGSSGSRTGAG